MFQPGERKWWPWTPLLLLEGVLVRTLARRLPPATGTAGRCGEGRCIRLVGLGDSIIAGVGAGTQDMGLVGRVAHACAERASLEVAWRVIGEPGATSADLLDQPLAQAMALTPQLVVLSAGVNDAVAGVSPAAFKRNLKSLVDGLTATRERPAIVFAGLPPMDSFPALPWPLSALLGERARRLQRAAVEMTGYRGLRVVVLPARLERAAFARDGFHPGPAGCATWGRWVADGFSGALESLADAPG